MQEDRPEQLPLHDEKSIPDAGTAVSATLVPQVKAAAQVAPQLMPGGELVTAPAPLTATLSPAVEGTNDAVTAVAAFSVTVHAPMPVHAPLHPAKSEPRAGAADSVTELALGKLAVQVVPQLIPAGELETVPLPAPVRLTVSVWTDSHRLSAAR